MAQLDLKWGGRAPQAPFIPDCEWEKHKELICKLRPTMTLDALIQQMIVEHNFSASRRQYKLRFHKWQLPNRKTLQENPHSSRYPIATVRKRISNKNSITESRQTPIGQTVPCLDEQSRLELCEDSSGGQNIQAKGKRLKSLASMKILGELPMMQTIAGQPDVDVSVATGVSPESEQDVSGESLFSEREADVDVSSGTDIRPPTKISANERDSTASSAIPANVPNAIHKADVWLAVGCYQRAYDLYSQWWETVRPTYTESADLPYLVFVIANMSRAASTPAEISHVLGKMEQLLIHLNVFHANCGVLDPIAECTLHIQLAILFRRHQDLSNAAHYCQRAVLILRTWSACRSVHCQDWGIAANLIDQYIKTAPKNFSTLPGEKWCVPCESLRRNPLKADFPCDGILRKLFAHCASRLSFPTIRQNLAEKLTAASRPDWDSETMTKALGILLFCQLWEPFACGDDEIQASLRDEVDWVHKICNGMRISSPDLFAGIAFVLVDLASPWYADSPKRVYNSSISGWSVEIEDVSLRLFHIPEAAHALASREGPQAEFMQSFFIAHAANNLTQVPPEISALDSITHLIERCIQTKILPQRIHCLDVKENSRLIAPNDPTLNPSPRSSISSGLRSMRALSRWIDGRDSCDNATNGNHTETLSIRSSESWSWRYQMRLSGTSSQILSRINTESSRGSAMDCKSEAGRVAQNVVG